MQIPSGILADKLGPKNTVTLFSILAAIGSVIFGLAPNIMVAYIGRFLVGIGVSVVFICLIKIQSRILNKYKDAPGVGCEKAYLVLIILVAVSFIATLFTTETGAKNIYDTNKRFRRDFYAR